MNYAKLCGLTRVSGHCPASQLGCLKGLGADATEMTVATSSIIEHLDVVEDICAGHFPRFVYPLFDSLFLQAAKE